MNELKGYAAERRVLYTRHQYYIDFGQFEWPDATYINLIRDPIDRFTSFYYFSRFGNKRAQDAGKTKQQVPGDLVNESIDDCITRRRRECKIFWFLDKQSNTLVFHYRDCGRVVIQCNGIEFPEFFFLHPTIQQIRNRFQLKKTTNQFFILCGMRIHFRVIHTMKWNYYKAQTTAHHQKTILLSVIIFPWFGKNDFEIFDALFDHDSRNKEWNSKIFI